MVLRRNSKKWTLSKMDPNLGLPLQPPMNFAEFGAPAIMHMKELPMFTYNLWMDCLHPDESCQLFCPVINIAMSNNFKHSHVHFTQFFQ